MSKLQTNKLQHTSSGASEFTLPTSDGTTGQFMKTDGSGVLSFETVDTSIADGSITAAKLASGVGGKIVNYESTIKTSTASTTSQSFVDISGMSVTINVSNSNHKVLVVCFVGTCAGHDAHYIALTYGNNTSILGGDAASGRESCASGGYSGGSSTGEGYYGTNGVTYVKLDEPATTGNVTYKLRFRGNDGNTIYFNRNSSDSGQYGVRTASTITAIELAP